MKISNSFLFDQATKNIQTAQSDVAKSREKIATGKSLVRPSDDTSKLRSIEILKSQQRKIESYDKSINFLTDRYKLEDSVLSSASDILIRLKDLAIQAANDTMSTADRDIIAVEVKSLRNELISLGNTRDVEGNFIFSGSRTETQPFVIDVATGDVAYAGDNRRLFAAVSESRTIQSNTDGTEIFQPVGRASKTFELRGFESEGAHNFKVGESVIEFEVTSPLSNEQIKTAISSSLQASQISSSVAVKTTETVTTGTVTNYDGVMTVSDGITTVTKDYTSSSPANLDTVLADIRAHASYGDLLFTVDKAANGTQLEYNWKTDSADYQVETVTVGTLGSYTALSISDGTTTITPAVPGSGAGYASIDAAVTAIKAATNYANLGFTVTKAYNGTDIEFIWKTTGDQAATATYAATGVANEAIATSTNKSPESARAIYSADDGGTSLGSISGGTPTINLTMTGSPGMVVDGVGVTQSQGDSTAVSVSMTESTTKGVDFFGMVGDLFDALSSDKRGDIGRAVSELTFAQESMAIAAGSIGAKLNNLERQQDINADFRLRVDQLLSSEEDLDYSKAVTQFNAEMVRLEATQASFARVAQLSLFEYI